VKPTRIWVAEMRATLVVLYARARDALRLVEYETRELGDVEQARPWFIPQCAPARALGGAGRALRGIAAGEVAQRSRGTSIRRKYAAANASIPNSALT
jgi:hypothetical protein